MLFELTLLLAMFLCLLVNSLVGTALSVTPVVLGVALLEILTVVFFYLLRIRPQVRRYRTLTRRFRDGEIYQDYISGIDGLFPDLKEDIDRLDGLIDRQNIMQLSTKQAEFLALQNQINPHFLYT